MNMTKAELAAENKRLAKALAPFAAIAKGIPRNWPPKCVLYWADDHVPGQYFIKYHGLGEDVGAPTIGDYQEAAKALKNHKDIEVHVLMQGVAICMGKNLKKAPREWPSGHSWVPVDQFREATCKKCARMALKLSGRASS